MGKSYGMTLVVIVGDCSTFVSKASIRRIGKTNVAALKIISGDS